MSANISAAHACAVRNEVSLAMAVLGAKSPPAYLFRVFSGLGA